MITLDRLTGILSLLLLSNTAAAACPVCATELGQQVRSGIFGPDFGSNLLAVLLPFPVLAAIVAGLHYGYSRERCASRTDQPPEAAATIAGDEEEAVWQPTPAADH